MKNEGLYPEEEMAIEQKAYESFLFAQEYGKEGVDHFKKAFGKLSKRVTYEE